MVGTARCAVRGCASKGEWPRVSGCEGWWPFADAAARRPYHGRKSRTKNAL